MFRKHLGEDLGEIVAPFHREFADYATCVKTVIQKLAEAEGLTQGQVLLQLLSKPPQTEEQQEK